MTPSDRSLSTADVDDVFEVLADWRRRAVCHYFASGDQTTANVAVLASAISEQEGTSTVDATTRRPRLSEHSSKRSTCQVLHRIGLIDYDERSGAVKYWGSPTVEKWADHAQAVTQRTDF